MTIGIGAAVCLSLINVFILVFMETPGDRNAAHMETIYKDLTICVYFLPFTCQASSFLHASNL